MRHDLTDWIIHFVHRRNPQNDPTQFGYDDDGREFTNPDGFTYDGKPIFLTDRYEEQDYGLESDANAISVLKKILHDGYIKAGWSYRNGSPTIYGPKAAVCFTEMPLYGLIDYARSRADEQFTEEYGIAFLKNELFAAGARPVIYGLSRKHEEADQPSDSYYPIGLRTLSANCGIGLHEQYRYVYTNLQSTKKTDWTHEREWRWADINEAFRFPGMPVFAKNKNISFSKIVVIVKTTDEAIQVIDQMKNLFHSRSTNYGREYDLDIIARTLVLALEELEKMTSQPALAKLEDLPLHAMPKIKHIEVPGELLEHVRTAVEAASEIAYEASKNFYEKHGDIGPCGRAHVVTRESNSQITQALIDLKMAWTFADGYYSIHTLKMYPTQSIDCHEAGAKAAADYLNSTLGKFFSYRSNLG